MILKTNRQAKAGFSLLEMTVVLIVISILASAVIPQFIKGYAINAANKTALDISAIEEASRAYYIANNQWPANIAALQAGHYLPSSWNAINPFGYSSSNSSTYSYNISSNASVLTVSTTVPVSVQPIIQNLLPLTSVSGNIINSSVSIPGASTNSVSSVPVGIIAAWSGTIGTIPSGWTLCNGVTVSRSDGNGTITPPDLRDRFMIGASQDNGGVAMTAVTGSPTQSGNGQLPATTISSTVNGAVFYNSTGAINYGYHILNTNGGKADSISFGTGSVNVAVYYALAFIMRI